MASCSICYEKLEEPSICVINPNNHESDVSQVSATTCGHLFHTNCILTWMSLGGSVKYCPVCNREISLRTLTTIYQDWSSDKHRINEATGGALRKFFNCILHFINLYVFKELIKKLFKTQDDFKLCKSKLRNEEQHRRTLASNYNEISRLHVESIALQKMFESELNLKEEEIKRLTRLLSELKTERNYDHQNWISLQMELNHLKALECIASLSHDSEAFIKNHISNYYLRTDSAHQFKIFKALEYQAAKVSKDRDDITSLFAKTKKSLDEAHKKSLSYSRKILQLQKSAKDKESARNIIFQDSRNSISNEKDSHVLVSNSSNLIAKVDPAESVAHKILSLSQDDPKVTCFKS